MFKLQAPLKYSPSDAIHLLRHFFHCSKQFLNSLILMPFSASANFFVCLFHLFHISRIFPSKDFFHPCKQTNKKVLWGEIWCIGRAGHGGHAIFGQRLPHTQHSVARCTCKSPIMKWAKGPKEPLKKIHWSWMQILTTVSAGALIQRGSQNTPLVGKSVLQGSYPSEHNSILGEVPTHNATDPPLSPR